MSTLNLGILAHVDAGKTSLTERLLHAAGVIDEIGRVDDGSTQTDSLALERQRGITIKSAVVSFVVGDTTVNLIDTPGHPDFIAEVERVLNVLDGAVLVIAAVEGVQAQTRVLFRALQRLRVPTLMFVNKIDRAGADGERVLQAIAERLTPAAVALQAVRNQGTRATHVMPRRLTDPGFRAGLMELLTKRDDALLAACVHDQAGVGDLRLRDALTEQTRRALVHPVLFGSAITGAGVEELIAAATVLLPPARGAADGPASGTVFKIERGPAGEKIAYARLFSGVLRTRERIALGAGRQGKVTAIRVFARGATVPRAEVTAGQIAKLWGLGAAQIGDAIGTPPATSADHHFMPPTLETVVVPRRDEERGALHVALGQLAEQDPLIDLRQDDVRHEMSVSLYGEVQKEVIQHTLTTDFAIDVTFRATTPICIERVVGSGAAVEVLGEAPNPFLATVGLRVDPAALGSGVAFRLEVELGSILLSFHRAVEETVHETLEQGLHGWQVTDCTITMTRSGYAPRQSHAHGSFDKSMSSTAGDFRNLTPLVLMRALQQAGTIVCEPLHRFRLDVPADTVRPLLPVLVRLRAVAVATAIHGWSSTIEGEIPAARLYELEQVLPSLTRGEAVLEATFDHHEPVRGALPTRARTDHDPLHRKDYLLRVLRRV